jgi:hypothetical protein
MLQSHTGITLQITLLIFTQYMSQHNLDILKKTRLVLWQNVLQKVYCFITVQNVMMFYLLTVLIFYVENYLTIIVTVKKIHNSFKDFAILLKSLLNVNSQQTAYQSLTVNKS